MISLEESAGSFLGGIADITVSKDPKTNKTHVSSAKLIPTVTVYEEDYATSESSPSQNAPKRQLKSTASFRRTKVSLSVIFRIITIRTLPIYLN